jgi:hypothetical protein
MRPHELVKRPSRGRLNWCASSAFCAGASARPEVHEMRRGESMKVASGLAHGDGPRRLSSAKVRAGGDTLTPSMRYLLLDRDLNQLQEAPQVH